MKKIKDDSETNRIGGLVTKYDAILEATDLSFLYIINPTTKLRDNGLHDHRHATKILCAQILILDLDNCD